MTDDEHADRPAHRRRPAWSDLHWSDLLGADVHDADLRDARLEGALYLTNTQLASARTL